MRTVDQSNSANLTLATGTLFGLTVLHFFVDTIAAQLNPLWPALEQHYRLGAGATFWLLLLWQLSTSFSQLAFGLIGAGPVGRWLLWLGPAIGAVTLGSLGLSTSPLLLSLMLILGGLGIAAFHPEGATCAGDCWPASRSRAMSIFAMGGFLGQSVGPYCGGLVVDHYGLSGLSGGIVIGLAAIVLLRFAMRGTHSVSTNSPAISLSDAWSVFRTERGIVALLLLIGTFRVIAASGAPITIAYWLTARGFSKAQIGAVQSAFLAGVGFGGLLAAVVVNPRRERFALASVPLLAAPCLWAVPQLNGVWLSAAMGLSGLALGIALPLFISCGQQLLPTSPRVGSSLTMGVSYGIGGSCVAAIVAVCERQQTFDFAFILFAVSVLVSCVLCIWLPALQTQPPAFGLSATLKPEIPGERS